MSRIDDSVQLNDEGLRCPRCGKRIGAQMTQCPACGYELVPHRSRMRCKQCGNRIQADATQCPHCGKDPRVDRISPMVPRLAAIVVGGLLIVCIGWIIFRAITTNILGHALGLDKPTAVPTQIVQVIYVVASPVPPTSTRTPTATPTKVVTPSPTKRGAKPVSTSTPTVPAVPPGYYPAVPLVAPLNTTVYTGTDANIVLQWQSVAPNGLRENEWYEIKLNYTARDGTPGERKSYSKETNWTIGNDLYKDISTNTRVVKWTVTVVRVDGIDPLVTTNRAPISIGGTTRTFIWN